MSLFVASLSKTLFWDVDPEMVDEVEHRRFIIQRVLERGNMQDWRNTKSHYGLSTVVQEAQKMRTLNPTALAFISCLGQVKKESFRCFTLQHLHRQHWPY